MENNQENEDIEQNMKNKLNNNNNNINNNQELQGNIQLFPNSDQQQMQHLDYKQNQKDQQHHEISDINIQGQSPVAQGINTLNEPIYITILRDLRMIWYKIKFVMTLQIRQDEGKSQLRNWDLWGPLLLCLILGLSLSIAATSQSDLIFSIIFVVIWIGGGVVTINAKLLKGQISFFQSVCVLGYCTCPITLFSFLIAIISVIPSYISLLLLLIAFAWSTYSSIGFMTSLVSIDKKYLAVYPLFLFYLFLFWFSYVTLTMKQK